MDDQQNLQPAQPPPITEWLATLFLPGDVAESIMGDLQEEFSGLVVKSGSSLARSWYRRHALRTIFHAGANASRDAPLPMLIRVIGGLWTIGFATSYTQHAMWMFLDANRVYEIHPNAYLFWLKFPTEIGRIVVCGLVGSLITILGNRKEFIAATTLAFAQIAMFSAGAIASFALGRDWFHWFVAMAPWNLLCAAATIVGGAIVRKTRRSDRIGPSVP